MIDVKQLRDLVIIPTVRGIGDKYYSESIVNLLLGTIAQESRFTYLKQLPDGPALSLYQMEPRTHDDIWSDFLDHRSHLAGRVRSIAGYRYRGGVIPHEEMIGNLYYATAMARIHYYRVPKQLPASNDVVGLALYWKQFYNTEKGAGTVDEFVSNYSKYINKEAV